jgi:endonuclease/exonuclease/phosphatase (EEP) superfamily protein YafD
MGMLRRLISIASWLTLGAVLAYWAGLRLIGESWWVTTILLYMPHVVLLIPVAVLALASAGFGPRRLLAVHAVAAVVIALPIMGLRGFGPDAATAGAPRMRLLSFNVGSGRRSIPAAVAEIRSIAPDIVVLQESSQEINDVVAAAVPGFATQTSTQFWIASRYPIVELHDPPKLKFGGVDRSPRFVRITLDSPLGRVDLYNIHPISPRDAIDGVRSDGRDARDAHGDRGVVGSNTALRRLQLEEISRLATSSSHPVIIAGDSNLPTSSRLLAELLGRWQDGFAAVGRGFGYTFPVGRHGAWMRIDRILAGPEFRFLQFGVGKGAGSDHYCVWADIERVSQ